MVALWNRADHYSFALWFLSFLSSFFPRLISVVGDWMSTILPHVECTSEMCCIRLPENMKIQDTKNRHFGTIAQLCRAVSLQLWHVSTIGKNLLNTDTCSTCPHYMVNFGLLTAEIRWRVLGTPANFDGFRVLAALLRSTLVVGVTQTLRRWTEGATCIWHGGHRVGHWPTFLHGEPQKRGSFFLTITLANLNRFL